MNQLQTIPQDSDGHFLGVIPRTQWDVAELTVYAHQMTADPAKLPARSTKLFPYTSRVKNQGNQGSCTGQGATAAAEIHARQNGILDYEGSEAYAYSEIRRLSNPAWVDSDSGGYVNRAGDVAAAGICEERFMPYNENDFRTRPNSDAYANALQRDYVLRHEPIVTGDKVLQVKAALEAGNPVLLAFAVHHSFRRTPQNHGVMPLDKDGIEGYHLVYANGYSDYAMAGAPNGGLFLPNSWDESWTTNFWDSEMRPGWFFCPYEAVADPQLFFEHRVIVRASVTPPPPPPNPDPPTPPPTPTQDYVLYNEAVQAIQNLTKRRF